jgi:cbb3-type cytochrome oxidase maturation protein
MDNVLQLELTVGIFISFTLLLLFIWSAKSGNFDDSKKMMDGMLFDSPEDLNAAVEKERKQEEMKAKKRGKKEE